MNTRIGILISIVPMIATQIGCAHAPAGTEADGVYEGTLYTVAGDGPEQRREDRFVLVTEAGPLTVVADGEQARRALHGRERDQVAIHAAREGDRLRFRALDDEPDGGIGRVEQADSATPRAGSWRFLVLACHFSDQPAVSPARAAAVAADIGKDAYPGVSHFYRSASRNSFNTSNAVAHPNVLQLSAPSSNDRYWSKDAAGNRTELDWYWAIPQECLSLARSQGVDLASYRGVAFVLDDGLLGGTAWGGGYSDGLSAVWLDTATNNPSTLIHEIGHGLGLNHLGTWADPFYYLPYNRRGNYWCNYASLFDPMGGGGCLDRNNPACYGAQFAAFHKESLGWLSAQTLTAPKGASQYFLSRADGASTALAMVRVPTAGSRSFTLEARRKAGTNFDGTPTYDLAIPREGVILHHMEPWPGYWEAVLIDPDQDCDSTDTSAVWTLGETFSDASGFSMTVTASQTDGYQVSVWRPYTLALSAGMAGYVVAESGGKKQLCKSSSSCELAFPKNAVVTLSAVATAGSFSGWTGCPQPSGTTCTFTHTGDRTIGAGFSCWAGTACGAASLSSLAITRGGAGGGRVLSSHFDCGTQCSGSVPYLDVVQLLAIPDAGSTFVRWEGACTGGALACDVVASGAKSVRAVFEVPVPLTVQKDGTGAGTVVDAAGGGLSCGATCAASYLTGTAVTLRATAVAGSVFAGWTAAGCGTATTCAVTMDAARTVKATFSLVPANLTATPGPGRVNLAWSAVSGATNYHVFSGTSPGAYSWSWYSGGATASTDWADWATLYYVVKAVMPSGESPASAEVSARGWSNLSHGKAASQASNWSSTLGLAGLAVDGNYDGDFGRGSVTTTNWGDQQWWQVDLGATHTLKRIDIYNRLDCCSSALSNFDVYTSTDGAAWTLRGHVAGQAGSPTVITVPSSAGRYARIQLASYATALMLAEVDVWGY